MRDVSNIVRENELLRKLGTRQGFFNYYFERLPRHRTYVECFNEINDLYMDLYGEERYTDYNSFRKQISQFIKK